VWPKEGRLGGGGGTNSPLWAEEAGIEAERSTLDAVRDTVYQINQLEFVTLHRLTFVNRRGGP